LGFGCLAIWHRKSVSKRLRDPRDYEAAEPWRAGKFTIAAIEQILNRESNLG
jgi:hypothetical protein